MQDPILAMRQSEFKELMNSIFQQHITTIIEAFRMELGIVNFEKPTQYKTVKEVMEMFQVTKPTVYSWVKKNIIKAEKIGNRTLFKLEELQKALSAENFYMPPEKQAGFMALKPPVVNKKPFHKFETVKNRNIWQQRQNQLQDFQRINAPFDDGDFNLEDLDPDEFTED